MHEERTGEQTSGEQLSDDIQNQEGQIDKAEQQHVKELLAWAKKVESQTWPDGKKILDICKENRKYVKGKQGDDGGKGLVRANLIQANIRRAINRTYARNPQISNVPTEAVTSSEYQKFRALGKTSEIVVNHLLKKARIKRKAKAALRAAKTCRIGWIKVGLQKNLEDDAFIRSRINDLQDNLLTLERLKVEVTDPDFNQNDQDKVGARILERQQLIESLEAGVEVTQASGITLDLIKTEQILIDVTQVEDLDDYPTAQMIGQKYFLSGKKSVERFGAQKAKSLSIFSVDEKDGGQSTPRSDEQNPKGSKITHIYELWDRLNLKVYTVGDGYKGYLKPPMTPSDEVGEQWYPFFPLAMNQIDGQFWPISDVELMMELQDEISSSLTKFKDHRGKSIPFTIFEKQAMDTEEVKKVNNPAAFEMVGIKGIPERKLNELLFNVQHNPIDPIIYSTDHLERKMEQVTGGVEATQPKSNRSKTLGEAKILTQETQTDSTSDQDEIEEWFADLATYIWQISLKVLTPEQVKKIAGDEAQWPGTNLSLPQIYNQLRLQVIPGSSGKPDKIREVETLSTIMPAAKEMIETIAKLRQEGQDDIAETQKILLQEFLRRADEKFDVEEFFPESADEEQRREERKRQQAQQQKVQQALVQLEMAEKQATIKKLESEAAKNTALAQAALQPPGAVESTLVFDTAKFKAENDLKTREFQLKAATDVQTNLDKIEANKALEQAKIVSAEKIASIEAAAEIRKAEIQADVAEKKLVVDSQNKDKEVEADVKTAEISAEASKETAKLSEKENSSKATEKTTQELSKVVETAKSAKGDEALGAIIKGLETVIKKMEKDDGGKTVVRDGDKILGIKPGSPSKSRTIN